MDESLLGTLESTSSGEMRLLSFPEVVPGLIDLSHRVASVPRRFEGGIEGTGKRDRQSNRRRRRRRRGRRIRDSVG